MEAVDESIEPIQDAILRIINGKASEETLAQNLGTDVCHVSLFRVIFFLSNNNKKLEHLSM